jgi:uncharacterized protein
MARRIPGRFDALRMARERGSLEGTVDVAGLARVSDRLAARPAPIAWRIGGTADASGRPALTVDLDGAVSLECQRCLAPLAWPVLQQTELLLARDAAELARLDASCEAEVVLADAPLDPLTLVEDELVLALPFAPRHPDGECTAPVGRA